MSRIGLTQRVEIVKNYRERRDCLDQGWTELLSGLGFVPIPLCNAISDVASYIDALDLDGIILTGGNDLAHLDGAQHSAPERDKFETALMDVCLSRQLKVLGVCRGMQMINLYFNGFLAPASGHSAIRHRIHGDGSDGLYRKQVFEVNSFHRYVIPRHGLASSLECLATADDSTVEALRHRDGLIQGMMWHPERESPFAQVDAKMLSASFLKGML